MHAPGDPVPATRPRTATALIVFALALAIRLGFMIGNESYRFDPADEYIQAGWETGRIAVNLAEGRGFRLRWGTPEPAPTAWVAPVYPHVVAIVYRALGTLTLASFVTVVLFQITLSALTAALLYVLGTRLHSPAVGLVAGFLFAVSLPTIRESAGAIVSVSLLVLLLVLVVMQLLTLERRPSAVRAAVAGAVIGLTLLTEPSPAAFFLVAAAWIAVRCGREGLRTAMIMGAIALLVVTPWTYRNYRFFGELFFIKSNFGQELFIGNNPEATGFWLPPGEVASRTLDPATLDRLNAALRRADEPAFSRMLGEAAVAFMVDQPGHAARLTGFKAVRFWTHEYAAPSWPFGDGTERIAVGAGRLLHYAVLTLAFAGAILALRAGGALVLPVLFLAVYPLSYVLTHIGHDRYRIPTLAFLYLLAAYGLVEGVERAGGRARTPPRAIGERDSRVSR